MRNPRRTINPQATHFILARALNEVDTLDTERMRTRGARNHRRTRPVPRGLEALCRRWTRPAPSDDSRRQADADDARLSAPDDDRPRVASSPFRTLPPLPLLELSRHLPSVAFFLGLGRLARALATPRIQVAQNGCPHHGERLLLRHCPRACPQKAHGREMDRLDSPLRNRPEGTSRQSSC